MIHNRVYKLVPQNSTSCLTEKLQKQLETLVYNHFPLLSLPQKIVSFEKKL